MRAQGTWSRGAIKPSRLTLERVIKMAVSLHTWRGEPLNAESYDFNPGLPFIQSCPEPDICLCASMPLLLVCHIVVTLYCSNYVVPDFQCPFLLRNVIGGGL